MLELVGAGKRFGDIEALAETDLGFVAGTTTAIIGPSGCGKTTLLRLLNGLETPDAGDVLFEGRPLAGRLEAARLRMGYVVQSGGLFPHLTAAANVDIVARFLRWPEARIRQRIETLLALVHLATDSLDRYPAELSGGQAQRVALMRALMLEPEVLLLDEPMAALDPMIRAELQQDLREIIARLGTTTVLVTHDLAEAMFLADRVVLLRHGSVIQVATGDALLRAPVSDWVARFVGAQRTLGSDSP